VTVDRLDVLDPLDPLDPLELLGALVAARSPNLRCAAVLTPAGSSITASAPEACQDAATRPRWTASGRPGPGHIVLR
jgi:hypothetical protein